MPSQLIEETATCPECGATSRFGAYRFIDATSDPELKQRVLDDSLFGWKCPECGYACRVYYDTILHDAAGSYVIALESEQKQRSLAIPAHVAALPNRDRLRLVKGGPEFKEKIRVFDAGIDDRALEGFKCFLIGTLEVVGDAEEPDAFLFDALDEDQIRFEAYAKGHRVGMFAAPDKVCRAMTDDLRTANVTERDDAFTVVDMRWAFEAFQEIANAK